LFLKLSSQKNLKIKDDDYHANEISEETFSKRQISIIKDQIDKEFTPCLSMIFTIPKIYKSKMDEFVNNLKKIDKAIQKNVVGSKQYKEDVLYSYRKTTNHDLQSVKDFESEFLNAFHDSEDSVFYFRNVFQQGLIRAWTIFCEELAINFNLELQLLTKSFLSSLEIICFDIKKGLWLLGREYLDNVVYSGQRIIVTQNSKKSITDLIISTFANANVITEFTKNLDRKEKLSETVSKLSAFHYESYFKNYQIRTKLFIEKNWKNIAIKNADFSFLKQRELNEDKKIQRDFSNKINEIVSKRMGKSKKILASIIDFEK